MEDGGVFEGGSIFLSWLLPCIWGDFCCMDIETLSLERRIEC
jgi:hypothetical protein